MWGLLMEEILRSPVGMVNLQHQRTFLTNSLYLGKQTAGYHHLLTAGIEKFPPTKILLEGSPKEHLGNAADDELVF